MKKVLLSIVIFFVASASLALILDTVTQTAYAEQCACNRDCANWHPWCLGSSNCGSRKNGTCVECRNVGSSNDCNNPNNVCNANHHCVPKTPTPTRPPLPTPTSAPIIDGYVDIAFIGDDYSATQMTLFHSHVDAMVSHLLTYEPFKTNASRIRIHYLDNTTDLYCHLDAVITRLPICNSNTTVQYGDDAYITGIVNRYGVPYDKIAVVWNTTAYGGAGGAILSITGGNSWSPQVFAHEFGHSFGGLTDEYILSSPYQPVGINCSATNPYAGWSGIVPSNSYFLGCNYPTWYRSSPDSIMNHLEAPYYNPISQAHLRNKLIYYGSVVPTPSSTPPSTPTPTGMVTPSPTYNPTPKVTLTPTPTRSVTPSLTPPLTPVLTKYINITSPVSGTAYPAGNQTVTISAQAYHPAGISYVTFVGNGHGCWNVTSTTSTFTCTGFVYYETGSISIVGTLYPKDGSTPVVSAPITLKRVSLTPTSGGILQPSAPVGTY